MKFYEKCFAVVAMPVGSTNMRNAVYVNFSINNFLFQARKEFNFNAGCLSGSRFNFTPRDMEKIQHFEMELRSY
jgi:hypothetical protein